MLLLVGTGVIVEQQLAGTAAPNATTIGLLAFMLLLILALTAPLQLERLTERITTFRLGGLELALTQAVRAGVVQRRLRDADDGVLVDPMKRTGDIRTDLSLLQHDLISRLKWLAREFQIGQPEPQAVLLALRNMNLLIEEQFLFASDLASPSASDLPALPPEAQDDYVKRAWEFVCRIRPSVLDRAIRHDLAERDWFVFDFQQTPGHRRDFGACRNDEWWLLTARIAEDGLGQELHDSSPAATSGEIFKVRQRWKDTSDCPLQFTSRAIVIPRLNKKIERRDGDPCVITRATLHRLADALSSPQREA